MMLRKKVVHLMHMMMVDLRQVMVVEPMRLRIALKLGMETAVRIRQTMIRLRNTTRCQQKPGGRADSLFQNL
jgi:hypothetical protein